MGIQTMGSQVGSQQSHLQSPLVRQSSWYNLTLDEVENQLRDLGKPLGSLNLDELLNTVWMAEANHQAVGIASQSTSSSSSLQRQASLTLARALSGKTVDELWRDIQHGEKKRFGEEIKREREDMLGEMTLEDFLVKAGIFAEASLGPVMGIDKNDGLTTQNFTQQISLLPSPSIGTLSDSTTSGRKRDGEYALEKTVERRQRRKIKNRESAARSRARAQAYQNELVSKVSHLEEENIRLKKEKEWENMLPRELPSEPKYQLRRTNSTCF